MNDLRKGVIGEILLFVNKNFFNRRNSIFFKEINMFHFLKKHKSFLVIAAMLVFTTWVGSQTVEAKKKNKSKKPVIVTNVSTLSFSGTVGATPSSKTFTIKNVPTSKSKADKILTWTASASSTGNWLSVSPSSGSVSKTGSPASVTVSVSTTGLSAGSLSGTITVEGTNADSVDIPVTLTLAAGTSSTSGTVLRGAIHGIVVGASSGNPVSGATVTLSYDKNGDGNTETVTVTTDSSGGYTFTNVPVLGGFSSVSTGGVVITPAAPYTIVIQATGYVAGYATALLTYEALIGDGTITTITENGETWIQIVGNLTVDAGIFGLTKSGAIMNGIVVNKTTGEPISGATVILTQGAGSVHGMTAQSATTVTDGSFTFTDLPELTVFKLAISASGFGSFGPSAVTGSATASSGTTTYVDFNSADNNPETPIGLIPITATPDTTPPFLLNSIISSGAILAPGGTIAVSDLAGPFEFTWSEAMDKNAGKLIINTTGFKAVVPSIQSWNTDGTVLTLTPSPNSIPKGVTFTITGFQTFRDLAGNAYNGLSPIGGGAGTFVNDMYVTQICGNAGPYNVGGGCTNVAGTTSLGTLLLAGSSFTANADDTLAVASGLTQNASTITDPKTGLIVSRAGLSNNENNLAAKDDMTLPYTHATPIAGAVGLNSGNPVLADAPGESNAITLSWTALTTLGFHGAYNIYAENNTGGFVNGIPVIVRAGSKSANPLVSTATAPVILGPATVGGTVDAAIAAFNALAAPGSLIPTIHGTNTSTSTTRGANSAFSAIDGGPGTSLFFDNGFSINMAVTAINANAEEGPFSNVVAVKDNNAPIIKEQDNYVAGGTEGFGWFALSAANTKQRPLYAITDSTSKGAGTATLNTATTTSTASLAGINPTTHLAGTYGAAEWTAFTAQTESILVTSNEDLSSTASPTVTVTDSSGVAKSGVSATAALTSVVGITDNDSNRELSVTLTKGAIAALTSGDRFTVNLTDEAGNAGTSDLHIVDVAGPFIVTAATSRTGSPAAEKLTITFNEPVTSATATVIGNYTDVFTVAGGFAGDTADKLTATLTASSAGTAPGATTGQGGTPGDYDGLIAATATSATPINAAGVADVDGNTFAGLGFNVADGIKPRVIVVVDTGNGTAVNSTIAPTANVWQVGDVGVTETYTLRLFFSEAIFTVAEATSAQVTTKVTGALSPTNYGAVAASTVAGAVNAVDLTFNHVAAAAAVAVGDTLTVNVTDQAGNTSSGITITLGAAAAGLTGFTGVGL